MVDAGLTPAQVIDIATGGSAKLLGAKDLGTLKAGNQADFMVLDADPLAGIHNTESLSSVWQRGNQVSSIHSH